MKIAVVRYFIVITAIAMVVGCGKEKKEEPKGEVLARVNGKVITMDQFNEEQAKLSPDIKATLGTAEGKKKFLETLVNKELLIAEAEKLGMGNDPSVAAKLEEIKKTLIIEAFLKKEIEEKAVFTEKEAEDYYNTHMDEFEGQPFEKIKEKVVATQTKKSQKDLFAGLVNSLKKEATIEINQSLLPEEVSVLDLVSNEYKYIGKTLKLYGYMSYNDTHAREFYLSDYQYKDKPYVVVSYRNCSNLGEIITQDPYRIHFRVTVLGILSGNDKIEATEVSF